MKNTVLLLTLLGPLAIGRIAYADTTAEARRHFDRAVELVDDGQLEGALVEFQRSYDLTHHFAVLYNIGQVLVSLARPVEAFDAYQRYLSEGRDIPAARRAEVEKEMARQKARIATLEIRGLPDGASVHVDGWDIGTAPVRGLLRVGVGKHVVAATAQGYEPGTSELTVAGEDYKVVNLVLTKSAVKPMQQPPMAPATMAVASTPTTSMTPAQSAALTPSVMAPPPMAGTLAIGMQLGPPPSQPMSKLRIAGIVMGSVGLAGLAAGTACWFAAESRHDDAMKAYTTDYPKAERLQSDAKGFATASSVGLLLGGSLTAAGVAMIIFGSPPKPTAVAPMHAYVLPSVGPGEAGLRAGGSW